MDNNRWAIPQDEDGGENEAATTQNDSFVTGLLVGLSVLVIVAAVSIMYLARAYPVIWRSYMFMNAPHSLVLVSVLAAGSLLFTLNRGGFRRAKIGNISGEGYATYLFLGLPLMLGFTQLGLFINGAADKSQPEVFDTVVVGKRVGRSSKSPPQWHVTVADWRQRGATVQVTVPEYQYDQITPGSAMRVVTKRGFLGYEWMVRHS